MRSHIKRLLFALIIIINILALVYILRYPYNLYKNEDLIILDPNPYDNITGYPDKIVPNIVHYVLFTIHRIEFAHFLSIVSVLRNQRPDIIYIHCDCRELEGEYIKRAVSIANRINTRIIVRQILKPTEIFGRPLS